MYSELESFHFPHRIFKTFYYSILSPVYYQFPNAIMNKQSSQKESGKGICIFFGCKRVNDDEVKVEIRKDCDEDENEPCASNLYEYLDIMTIYNKEM